ncbi:hypothetical protein FRB95_012718 [Tulasnella sp. JGI-2019a]|nr:hypothetical protein FRB95_012718 [Tulasnella sp. JGI-2019a]
MAMPKSVNELPAEILGMVFFESLEEDADQKSRRQRPEHLAHVCRLWKELVEGHPELWSRIDVVLGDAYYPMKVERISNQIGKAKRSPLALYLHWNWQFTELTQANRDIPALYDLIKDHRWRALSIFNPGSLSPFEIFFRHMVDHPQMWQFFSFCMETTRIYPDDDMTGTLVKEALRQNRSITHLTAPMGLLEPTYVLHQMVSHLQLTGRCNPIKILSHIREASSLRSLRVEFLKTDLDDSTPPCILPKLESLDLHECREFPKRLIQKLDLPHIWSLKLGRIACRIKQGDQELKSLVLGVPWLTQITSLNLEAVPTSEVTLSWTLRRLPLLRNLTLTSRKRVTCKTTKKLSEQPTARRGWLCPFLEEIEFRECWLREGDVMALVDELDE